MTGALCDTATCNVTLTWFYPRIRVKTNPKLFHHPQVFAQHLFFFHLCIDLGLFSPPDRRACACQCKSIRQLSEKLRAGALHQKRKHPGIFLGRWQHNGSRILFGAVSSGERQLHPHFWRSQIRRIAQWRILCGWRGKDRNWEVGRSAIFDSFQTLQKLEMALEELRCGLGIYEGLRQRTSEMDLHPTHPRDPQPYQSPCYLW